MTNRFRAFIARLLVVSMTGLAIPFPAQAGMLSSEAALGGAERDRVAGLLERADVRAKLETLGVSPAEVKARIDALSDAEAAQLARQIDTLPAGGDGIIGALVLIFVVLLLTDILGFTKIFPFTRPIR